MPLNIIDNFTNIGADTLDILGLNNLNDLLVPAK